LNVIKMQKENQEMSYHDNISGVARGIEQSRKKSYTQSKDNLIWSERQLHFINMIEGKIVRLRLMIKDKDKAIDDIIDIYNFTALLYEETMK
jgi:hypothetical protein